MQFVPEIKIGQVLLGMIYNGIHKYIWHDDVSEVKIARMELLNNKIIIHNCITLRNLMIFIVLFPLVNNICFLYINHPIRSVVEIKENKKEASCLFLVDIFFLEAGR